MFVDARVNINNIKTDLFPHTTTRRNVVAVQDVSEDISPCSKASVMLPCAVPVGKASVNVQLGVTKCS